MLKLMNKQTTPFFAVFFILLLFSGPMVVAAWQHLIETLPMNSKANVFRKTDKEYHYFSGFPRALEIMENLENHEKKSMHGKIMEFEGKKPE